MAVVVKWLTHWFVDPACEGSIPFYRPNKPVRFILCRCGGIGRRAGLKIQWWQHRVGSTPTDGITEKQYHDDTAFLFLF